MERSRRGPDRSRESVCGKERQWELYLGERGLKRDLGEWENRNGYKVEGRRSRREGDLEGRIEGRGVGRKRGLVGKEA